MLRAVLLTTLFLAFLFSVPAAAGSGEMDDLLAGLASGERSERDKAASGLADLGAAAVKPLVKLAAGENRTAASAARVALELLVHRAADPGKKNDRAAVAEALLAEVAGSWPLTERRRLLRLVSFAGCDSCVPILAGLLHDSGLGDMALFALTRIPGDGALAALHRALAEASPAQYVGLIHAVAARGNAASAGIVAPFLDHGDQAVRIAAIEALGKIPDGSSGPILWEIVTKEKGAASARAAAAALDLADTLLKAGLEEKAVEIYARFCLAGPAVHQRCAGLEGLSRIQGSEMVPMLTRSIQLDIPEFSGTAVDILSRMEGPEVDAALAGLVSRAEGNTGVHLVHAMGRRHGADAFPHLKGGLESDDPGVRIAVLEVLGGCGGKREIEIVFQAAADRDEKVRAAAVRTCLRIGESLAAGDRVAALDIFLRALEAAEAVPEKTMALQKLGALGDPAAVPVFERFLNEKNHLLSQAAARGMAPLARKMADDETLRGQAVGLLRTIVRRADDPGIVRDAASMLRDLGIEVDVPVRPGYVKHFWLIGPIPGRSALLGKDLFPVDERPDLKRAVRHEGKEYAWRYHPLLHIHGKLDLIAVVADQDNAGVYAYAEVESKTARKACFKIGSDDDVFCWLNGGLVHSFQGGRGWSADQDSADVVLEPGTNTILLKVLNGGGDWAVSLRITDRDGNPIDLKQRRP